jgi:polyhydroxyalkanoate synthesis regulator phasin
VVELLKKTVLASIGAVYMTKEKIKDLAEKVAKETELSEADGKKFVSEILHKSDEAKTRMESLIQEYLEKTLKSLSIPSRKEFEALEKRIELVEQSHKGSA